MALKWLRVGPVLVKWESSPGQAASSKRLDTPRKQNNKRLHSSPVLRTKPQDTLTLKPNPICSNTFLGVSQRESQCPALLAAEPTASVNNVESVV